MSYVDKWAMMILFLITWIWIVGTVGIVIYEMPDNPSEGIVVPLEAVRELHCAEDSDIVVTLGSNGLPYAFCEQVIER